MECKAYEELLNEFAEATTGYFAAVDRLSAVANGQHDASSFFTPTEKRNESERGVTVLTMP
jgi:hypothetical protein